MNFKNKERLFNYFKDLLRELPENCEVCEEKNECQKKIRRKEAL